LSEVCLGEEKEKERETACYASYRQLELLDHSMSYPAISFTEIDMPNEHQLAKSQHLEFGKVS
jgi:hypothetical protein